VSQRCLRSLSFFVLALAITAFPAGAAELLFPKALHLTRRVHDSIGGATTVVEQYCYGNRVITVSGNVTTIADYDKSEITEINRADGTYSISRFDQGREGIASRFAAGIITLEKNVGVTESGTCGRAHPRAAPTSSRPIAATPK